MSQSVNRVFNFIVFFLIAETVAASLATLFMGGLAGLGGLIALVYGLPMLGVYWVIFKGLMTFIPSISQVAPNPESIRREKIAASLLGIVYAAAALFFETYLFQSFIPVVPVTYLFFPFATLGWTYAGILLVLLFVSLLSLHRNKLPF